MLLFPSSLKGFYFNKWSNTGLGLVWQNSTRYLSETRNIFVPDTLQFLFFLSSYTKNAAYLSETRDILVPCILEVFVFLFD